MHPFEQITAKLIAEGITFENYTRESGKEALSRTVMPVVLGEYLDVHEKEILQILKTYTMSTFFKALSALLQDRQDFRLQAVKIKEDLVLTITPDFKGKGKITHVTIPAEDLQDPELDSKIFGALNGPPVAEKASFQTAQTDAPEREEEEEEDDKQTDTGNPKRETKAAPKKKAPAKKAAPAKKGKKQEKPAPADPVHEADLKETLQEEEPEKEGPTASEDKITEVEFEQTSSNEEAREIAQEVMKDNGMATPEPVKEPEPVEEDKDDGPNIEDLFKHFMAEGKKLFAERKYADAETAFASAVELKPEHKDANAEHRKAKQWAKAVADIHKQ